MKTRKLLLLIALTLAFSAATYSQGYIIRRAINRQVDKEVDAAVDKEVQESKDKKAKEKEEADAKAKAEQAQQQQSQPEAKTEKSSEQGAQQAGGNMGGLFANKVTLKYNEEYNFTSRMYSQTEMYDKKDVIKMDYYLYFSSNSPTAGIETKTINTSEGETPLVSNMIMDGTNKCFIMLTDVNGMKMGMISAVPDEVEQAKQPVVTKTGNSKNIMGFKCDEYLYKPSADTKEYWKMWFTKDAVINIDKRAWSQTGMPSSYGYAGFDNGMIMAWESYDKNNKLTGKSEVKEINNNFSHSMSVKGYSLRQMDMNKQKKN